MVRSRALPFGAGAKGAASDLDRLRDKFDRLQKQGAKGFAIGVGAAATWVDTTWTLRSCAGGRIATSGGAALCVPLIEPETWSVAVSD